MKDNSIGWSIVAMGCAFLFGLFFMALGGM
jgi:hypothetical protein